MQAGEDFDKVAQINSGAIETVSAGEAVNSLKNLGVSESDDSQEAMSGDSVSNITVPEEGDTAPARSRGPSRGQARAAGSAEPREPSRNLARPRSTDRKQKIAEVMARYGTSRTKKTLPPHYSDYEDDSDVEPVMRMKDGVPQLAVVPKS